MVQGRAVIVAIGLVVFAAVVVGWAVEFYCAKERGEATFTGQDAEFSVSRSDNETARVTHGGGDTLSTDPPEDWCGIADEPTTRVVIRICPATADEGDPYVRNVTLRHGGAVVTNGQWATGTDGRWAPADTAAVGTLPIGRGDSVLATADGTDADGDGRFGIEPEETLSVIGFARTSPMLLTAHPEPSGCVGVDP